MSSMKAAAAAASSSSSSPPSSSMDRDRNKRSRPVFLRDLVVIRLINAWWLTTFVQPDEFFQTLEPAWDLAFGPRSDAWMTWEWHYQIRTSLHPALFAGLYLATDFIASHVLPTGILRAAILVAAPRALQAVIAALGDWYTWKLAVSIYGDNSNLFLQLFNPWQWYFSTRTFANSFEGTLTIMALYYWPWELLGAAQTTKENPKPAPLLRSLWSLRASLCLAALAVILRPTNILIWITIVLVALTRISLQGPSPLTLSPVLVLLREAILCGSLVLAVAIASDRLYFGFWTFPPYNFLYFNLAKSLAVFYGRNPWHYYLLQGLPLICTTSLPFAILALCRPSAPNVSLTQLNTLKTLAYTVLTTLGALSAITHKEVRFIYPVLPVLSVLAAPYAAPFFTSQSAPTTTATSSSSPRAQTRNKPYLFAALGVNIFLAGYLSFFHQCAPHYVVSYLRHEYERIHPDSVKLAQATRFSTPPDEEEELFALFLMPCHSTPWRSHFVYPGLRAYALTCEPPLHTQPNTPERDNYRDEADRFYDNPIPFLTTELFGPAKPLSVPRYIVGFEGIEPWLEEFLQTPEAQALGLSKIRRVWGGFNGFFNEDWRRAGEMIVWDTGVYENAPPEKA